MTSISRIMVLTGSKRFNGLIGT